MTRALHRALLAITVALALTFVTVPTAHAKPLEAATPGFDTSWLDAALAWISSLLGGGEGLASMSAASTGDDSTSSDDTSTISTYRPLQGSDTTTMTGACIDPWGQPKPCSY